MMPRVAAIIALSTAICLAAPKERAWQDGRLLDTRDNPYFTGKDFSTGAAPSLMPGQTYNDYTVMQNSSTSKVVYDHYVVEGRTSAYLLELGRLKDYPTAHVVLRKGLKFAVEKNKAWFIDEDGKEIETKLLKEVARPGVMVTKVETPAPVATPAPAPSPVPAPVVVEQPQVAQQVPAPAPAPVPAPAVAPQPAPQQVAQAAPAVPMQESLVATKQEVKAPPVVVKETKKPEPPAAKAPPQVATAVKETKDPAAGNSKDRPWQRGQLLSTAANPFFANIPYTTDSDASSWTFVQGADGKATAFLRAGGANSAYIYDNYVIESDFCGYLIQRSRLKTVPPARFPGTKPLKFAIEKNKIWVTDEDGKEYEAKIVKTIQKDPDPAKPAGLSTASR
jgi:hypothetical protein